MAAIKGATRFPSGPNNKSGIHWFSNPFDARSAAAFELHFKKGLAAHTEGFAKQVEQYAKDNAPWEDRTTQARDGLTAKGQQRLNKYTITLYHTVDYGIWLEVRWSGRFAIILPTVRVMGQRLMESLDLAKLMHEGGG